MLKNSHSDINLDNTNSFPLNIPRSQPINITKISSSNYNKDILYIKNDNIFAESKKNISKCS